MSERTSRRATLRMVRAIRKVADCPCPKHQAAFLRQLQRVEQLICKVGDDAVGDDAVGREGPYITQPGDDVGVTTVVAQGHTFILSFPSIAAARRHDPAATYAGIPRDVVLKMAVDNPELTGVLVTSSSNDDAWAAATRQQIVDLFVAEPG